MQFLQVFNVGDWSTGLEVSLKHLESSTVYLDVKNCLHLLCRYSTVKYLKKLIGSTPQDKAS